MKFVFSSVCLLMATFFTNAQQIKINFANNLNDSSINHYLIDTNNCGNALTFCADASGNANNAYQFDGLCSMQTDSFSMTNTNYPGMSLSFYMNKNFESDTIQYGLFHFYKGPFLVYALHDSMFIVITDSLNTNYTYGVPCAIPNGEWFCGVISFKDYGPVDFYFNKVKYNAGSTNYKILRRACEPGFCYWFSMATELWSNKPFKGKLDDVRVWNWPSDSVNVDEICTKTIVPAGVSSLERTGAKLYPNPASNYMILESNYKGSVIIYDMLGRIARTQNMEPGMNNISVEQLMQGNYVLVLKTAQGISSQRVLIQ
ncbi:MAG: T9SS type A sorting domain-containing protein [Bacteroidetes bacterium]|nr:T9SS type A sorting domain-containing protein [Bacteroidota bacterium]